MKGGSWWGNSYIKSFEDATIPVILVDQGFTYQWANKAAKALFPNQAINEVVNRFIFSQNFSTIFDQLTQKSTVQVAAKCTLQNDYDFQLSPVFDKENLIGCVVKLCKFAICNHPLQLEGIDRILATFTHQTRNPLSTIFAALSGITRCNDELEDPAIREYVNKISTQCYRLLRSSANISEVNRYQHGLSTFSPKKQDLCLFLEQLCRIVSVMIESIGIRFRYSVPGEPVITMFDPEKISTVVLNLISNAAKFIGEQGEILVTLGLDNGQASISVKDNGLGINDKILQRVFETYFSYDPRSAGICGDGLGLTMSKMIVLEHGGSIAVNSHEGVGTKVVFTVPIKPDESTQLTISDVANEYLCDRFSNMFVILSDVCKTPDF